MSKSTEKDKWYPGKYIKERRKSSQSAVSENEDFTTEPTLSSQPSTENEVGSSSSNKSSGWYPGKYVGRKSQSKGVVDASRGSGYPIAGSPPSNVIGNINISVLGAKFMSATRPSFEIWAGNQVKTFEFLGLDVNDGSSNEEFEVNFPVSDITSDVFILAKEEYSIGSGENNFIGRIVIPLSAYVTPRGAKPPILEWMTIYPIVDTTRPMDLYQPGLKVLPGSAMPRTKHSLGFLAVRVQLLLSPGPVYGLYLEGEPPLKMLRKIASYSHEEDSVLLHDDSESANGNEFDAESFYRTYLRLKRITSSSPAALAPVLRFPEVFILIVLFGFICFGAEGHHIPMIIFVVVLINGFLSISEKKNFNDLILWNTLIDSRRDSAGLSSVPKGRTGEQCRSKEFNYECLKNHLHGAQQDLERMVANMEAWSNIWNFSDMQVSILFYGALLVVCAIASTVTFIFSIRPLVFAIGSIILLGNALRDIFPELMSMKPIYSDGTGRENTMNSIRKYTTKFWMLLARVPNDAILEHRFIARSCIVEDNGIEMEDAAQKKII